MTEMTIGRAVRLAAELRKDAVALTCGGVSMSHRELDEVSNRLANGLLSMGLKKGDRVAAMLPNCSLYVVFACALAKAGLVMMTINYRFREEEIIYQLKDAEASALLFHSDFAEAVQGARRTLPNLKYIVEGAGQADWATSLRRLIDAASPSSPNAEVSETDPFYLGYTSGTSGRPKGAIVSHRNRYMLYIHMAAEYGVSATDKVLHAGPFHHTAPFAMTMAQICLGGSAVILPSFDAVDALEVILAEKPTWTFMVPYMFNALTSLPQESRAQLRYSSLKTMLSGGAALPTAIKLRVLETFPNAGLHEFYGATECGTICNLRPEDQARTTRSVGKPFLGAEVKIIRDGVELGAGEVGEIHVRTMSQFAGYYKDPTKTGETLRDGWVALGDLGRKDDEGFVYIVDRTKDVIKSGGVAIFPSEIEEVLLMNPHVSDVAVIGIPSEKWGESVHAIVVARGDHTIGVDDLIALCRDKLAGYKVPKSIEVRTELPRSPAGKILKRVLRDEFWQSADVKV